ncbi:hypothetical protein ACFLQJ_03260, partial [Calditrichota bacterium]
ISSSDSAAGSVYEYKLRRFDTTGVGFSDEARIFADEHWNESVYRGYEFWLAQFYPPSDRQYAGDMNEWANESWADKIDYLPTWFTYELPVEKNSYYYQMIGIYTQQFGIGWEDVHTEYDETDPEAFYMDYLREDQHLTFSSALRDQYIDMW